MQDSAKTRFESWDLPKAKLRTSRKDPSKKIVTWPATNQALQVTLGPPFTQNCLQDFICWVYDGTNATVIVKTATDEHILHTARDLLRFYHEDIERLSKELFKINTKLVDEIPIF